MNFSKYINLKILPSSVTGQSENTLHLPYKEEVHMMNIIREGKADELLQLVKLLSVIPVGELSHSTVTQYRYIAICFITLAVRYAISGGMNESEAYSFSDYFIRQIDALNTSEEILNHIALAFVKLTNSVHESKTNAKYSPYVRKCINYINDNLTKKITVGELAEVCNVSGDYLSSVFKKEYGKNLSEYIMERKLDAARTMLADGMKQSEVCYTLSFSSQSYFINAFKKQFGITPGKYVSQLK